MLAMVDMQCTVTVQNNTDMILIKSLLSYLAEWPKNTHMLPITLPKAGDLH